MVHDSVSLPFLSLGQELEIVLCDAHVFPSPFANSMLRRKQSVLFFMIDFLTRALPCWFSCTITSFLQTTLDTPFSLNVLPFSLLRPGGAISALQAATALVVVVELFCVEMFPAKVVTAIGACVRTYIVRMVAFLPTDFAH